MLEGKEKVFAELVLINLECPARLVCIVTDVTNALEDSWKKSELFLRTSLDNKI
jgi:hypothetical protein